MHQYPHFIPHHAMGVNHMKGCWCARAFFLICTHDPADQLVARLLQFHRATQSVVVGE